ncbi:MAG TPA: hypothetical protein VK421_06090 [Pyrinomonadaceae bacterium]|nr:hypothetical protein [Pyrinomonadaceae bacterium]
MLKIYDKLDDVPEALREHYKLVGGRYVPELSDDHPVLSNNRQLVTEKQTAERERDEAKGALAAAKVIPHGHVAVPKADHDLAVAVKAAGITKPEDFNTLKTERDNYKTTAEAAEAAAHAHSVGAVMGWDKEKTARLATKVYDFSTLEVRDGKDGKKEVVAKVKQGDNSFVERPFADVVKSTPELSDLLPALSSEQRGGVRVPGSTPGGGAPPADVFKRTREAAKADQGKQADDMNPVFKRQAAA